MYHPKSIMITGGSGFIGSFVIDLLVSKYPDVKIVNYDILTNTVYPLSNKEAESHLNYKFVRGNICSSDLVEYVIKTEDIDTIIHFAAETHVDNSFGNSIKFTKTNIFGTHIMIETAMRCGIKRFIHVSTDEVYGETDCKVKESSVLEPTNPYAATKAGAEMIAKSYYRSFNFPLIITRGNNVYGPRQYPEKLIPKTICRLFRDRPACVHGNGLNERNYIYVEDVAKAFDTILHHGVIGEVYNIGTHDTMTNIDVIKDIITYIDGEIEFVEDRKYNDKRYHISTDKINELGWFPETNWKEGLEKTIKWYKDNSSLWINLDTALSPHPIM